MSSTTKRHQSLPVAKCLLVLGFMAVASHAWLSPQSYSRPHHHGINGSTRSTTSFYMAGNDNQGPFSFLTNPYESKIPPELQKEIYAAEAKTPAALERGTRVAAYALVAFIGIVLAFFSAFITELRNSPLPDGQTGDPLTVAGFDWVRSNFVTSFLFTNKIGGGICLLGGAGAGLMAEAELDTKRINAEKIFEEMERRRDSKGKSSNKKSKQKKKKRSGKERKRLGALAEVVAGEPKPVAPPEESVVDTIVSDKKEEANDKNEGADGLLGKMKDFYEQADNMAASQALLLNKELEDRGLVEKITDETGLKVVGREEAEKLEQKRKKDGKIKD